MLSYSLPSKISIGIDPGLTGAIAVFSDDRFLAVYDMPTRVKSETRKRNKKGEMQTYRKYEIDPSPISGIIYNLTPDRRYTNNDIHCCIEQVSAMRKGRSGDVQGTVSAFNFGDSFGSVRAVCEVSLSQNKVHCVVPTVWKKHFGLLKQEKDAARIKAIELVPGAEAMLKRKKDGGRADAILIAKYLSDMWSKYVSNH